MFGLENGNIEKKAKIEAMLIQMPKSSTQWSANNIGGKESKDRSYANSNARPSH